MKRPFVGHTSPGPASAQRHEAEVASVRAIYHASQAAFDQPRKPVRLIQTTSVQMKAAVFEIAEKLFDLHASAGQWRRWQQDSEPAGTCS